MGNFLTFACYDSHGKQEKTIFCWHRKSAGKSVDSSKLPHVFQWFFQSLLGAKKTKRLSKICIVSFLKIQSGQEVFATAAPTKIGWEGGQRWHVVCTLQIVCQKCIPKPFANCFHIDSIRNGGRLSFSPLAIRLLHQNWCIHYTTVLFAC